MQTDGEQGKSKVGRVVVGDGCGRDAKKGEDMGSATAAYGAPATSLLRIQKETMDKPMDGWIDEWGSGQRKADRQGPRFGGAASNRRHRTVAQLAADEWSEKRVFFGWWRESSRAAAAKEC